VTQCTNFESARENKGGQQDEQQAQTNKMDGEGGLEEFGTGRAVEGERKNAGMGGSFKCG